MQHARVGQVVEGLDSLDGGAEAPGDLPERIARLDGIARVDNFGAGLNLARTVGDRRAGAGVGIGRGLNEARPDDRCGAGYGGSCIRLANCEQGRGRVWSVDRLQQAEAEAEHRRKHRNRGDAERVALQPGGCALPAASRASLWAGSLEIAQIAAAAGWRFWLAGRTRRDGKRDKALLGVAA
jgi:hypothetical protein